MTHKLNRQLLAIICLASPFDAPTWAGVVPSEPVKIGHEPQFLFDTHIVDNHWGLKDAEEGLRRVVHQPKKHPANPVLAGDSVFKISNVWVARDKQTGLFRMWYQNNMRIGANPQDDRDEAIQVAGAENKGTSFTKDVAYAESKDGIHWEKPNLNLFPAWKGRRFGGPNNIVLESESSAAGGASLVLDVPEKDRRGYRHIMMYRRQGGGGTAGIYLVGSHDGMRWDDANKMLIARLASDTHNTLVYDPQRDEYVMFCRSKHIYTRGPGRGNLDALYSRRVARMASETLWTNWDVNPQTVLIPDEGDYATGYKLYYGMPTRYYAGVYWGFLQHFRLNDYIFTELVVSRDGFSFDRMPGRPKLIEYGPEGTWDDTMIFTSPWVEVGDEWWLYYAGADGPHNSAEKGMSIGLVTVRKEGLISLRGPAGGGMVVSRRMVWPGGGLIVNADARGGEVKVRVSDEKRVPIGGFDFDDSAAFTGDRLAHEIRWGSKSLDRLAGRIIRLEFYLRDADLYTFRAAK